ncbi:MAG: desulfoferrodoxin FeS4 iron-binding domain-containing protein, partial [Syntrophales bacterium]|nr:desulfoferrodoxin FeS4 iron-binding domain-containing protein [Syntrophales bacterium]
MAEKNQVYKCTMCGNIVEVLHGGNGKLSCCGQPLDYRDRRADSILAPDALAQRGGALPHHCVTRCLSYGGREPFG